MKRIHAALLCVFLTCLPAGTLLAEEESLLTDRNGDSNVEILAFGDSLTAGVGDTDEAGGYPSRLRNLLGVSVVNSGVPGEELCKTGYTRFPQSLSKVNPDIAVIFEGANDAREPQTDSTFQWRMQRLINTAIAQGRLPVLVTFPQPCCNHALLAPYTPGYSAVLRNLGIEYGIPVVDLEHVWGTTCINKSECELFNLPEGLHPNATGYTAIAQAVAATLLGIDLFSEDGASQLEKQLGLPSGTVIVKPDLSEN